MKKILLLISLMLCLSQFGYAQWVANGANINNTNTGFVGIGTTTPAYPLDINGTLRVTNGIVSPLINKLYLGYLGTDTNSLVIGKYGTGLSSTGGYNIAIGPYALAANTTGSSNVGIGYQALSSNTTGVSSIAIGPSALLSNTTASVMWR